MINFLRKELRGMATKERAKNNAWYFKTEKGQYGEGDIFLGVTVPGCRKVAKRNSTLSFVDLQKLLDSRYHEERLTALLILVLQYQKGDYASREKIFEFYIKNLSRVNNWDLVDLSAHHIVGAHLFGIRTILPKKMRALLTKLSASPNLWYRRVAILATFYFINQGEFAPSLDIAKRLMGDKHDLIHKALGWMLREVGKRDLAVLENFLLENGRYKIMPRAMLRYAIERFPEPKRKKYLLGTPIMRIDQRSFSERHRKPRRQYQRAVNSTPPKFCNKHSEVKVQKGEGAFGHDIITHMNDEELKLSETARLWVKSNHKELIKKFADTTEYVADALPTTLFMAGSPGAGKTEISKRFVPRFKQKPIRIDADEIRAICPGYTGSNAHVFQDAATKGVHILYDYAIEKNINVIMDGTFAYSDALKNINRALGHGRKVEIFFVYQDPLQAWDFTKKREALEQRRVSKDVFVESFFKARENVNKAKETFGSRIELNLVIKDFEKDLEQLEINIENIDRYIKKSYTKEELRELLT